MHVPAIDIHIYIYMSCIINIGGIVDSTESNLITQNVHAHDQSTRQPTFLHSKNRFCNKEYCYRTVCVITWQHALKLGGGNESRERCCPTHTSDGWVSVYQHLDIVHWFVFWKCCKILTKFNLRLLEFDGQFQFKPDVGDSEVWQDQLLKSSNLGSKNWLHAVSTVLDHMKRVFSWQPAPHYCFQPHTRLVQSKSRP